MASASTSKDHEPLPPSNHEKKEPGFDQDDERRVITLFATRSEEHARRLARIEERRARTKPAELTAG